MRSWAAGSSWLALCLGEAQGALVGLMALGICTDISSPQPSAFPYPYASPWGSPSGSSLWARPVPRMCFFLGFHLQDIGTCDPWWGMSEGTFPGSPSGAKDRVPTGSLGPALGRKDEQGRPVPHCWPQEGAHLQLCHPPQSQGSGTMRGQK